jgi:hypothetical protein
MRVLAYIDLPSGSAIFQILIAGLLGISVAFRSFWNRVWQLLTGRRARKEGSSTDSSASSASSAEAPRPAASPEESPSAADTSVPRSSEDASARKG